MFPTGWPGVGLLLLRVCLAAALIYFDSRGPSDPWLVTVYARQVLVSLAAVFLLAGLWTPLVAVVIVFDEIRIAFLSNAPAADASEVHVVLAVLSASVAMLGPGGWSIDARLFGRKRLTVDKVRGRTRPSR